MNLDKTKQLIAKHTKKSDHLYIQHTSTDKSKVWISEGHWMIKISIDVLPDEYREKLETYKGTTSRRTNSKRFTYWDKTIIGDNMEKVIPNEAAYAPANITDKMKKIFREKRSVETRIIDSVDSKVSVHVDEKLLNVIYDILDIPIAEQVSTDVMPVIFTHLDEIVALLMPLRK